jgi:hypothetical protein
MFILDTHIHKLRFRIDTNAPIDYMNRCKKLKYDCDNGDNKYIVEKMKTYCKLGSNKTLPYLQRTEGGFGGNDNIMNKQIRFRICCSNSNNSQISDNDIILDQVNNTETEKWTYDELDDIIRALTKTFNYFVESECVNGVIEISNKESMSDDYLDSDDESG